MNTITTAAQVANIADVTATTVLDIQHGIEGVAGAYGLQITATDAGYTVTDNCGADNDHATLAAAVADAIECIEETDTEGELTDWTTALRSVSL